MSDLSARMKGGAGPIAGACVLVVAGLIIAPRMGALHRARESQLRSDVSRSEGSIAEIDPHVAATESGGVAISWMAVSHKEGEGDAARATGVRTSTDFGTTFSEIRELKSPDARFSTDSMLTSRGDEVILTWLGFHQRLARGGEPYDLEVYLSLGRVSAHDPPVFSAPMHVTKDVRAGDKWMRFDKPWTAVLGDGTIATSYRYESAGGAGIRVSRTRDGMRFDHAIVTEGKPFVGTLATICAAPSGGRAWVAYVDAGHSIWANVVVHASEDSAATWPEDRRTIASRAGDHAVVEAPFCASDGDRVWVAYGLSEKPPDDSSSALYSTLVLARSNDGARTWTDYAEYKDPGALILHPTWTRLFSGDFDLMYLTGKSEGDAHGRVERVRLGPDGARRGDPQVLQENVRLVAKRAPLTGWTGDFMGLATQGNHELGAFAANADGAPHVRFRNLSTGN